jgi:hypothetical protein
LVQSKGSEQEERLMQIAGEVLQIIQSGSP